MTGFDPMLINTKHGLVQHVWCCLRNVSLPTSGGVYAGWIAQPRRELGVIENRVSSQAAQHAAVPHDGACPYQHSEGPYRAPRHELPQRVDRNVRYWPSCLSNTMHACMHICIIDHLLSAEHPLHPMKVLHGHLLVETRGPLVAGRRYLASGHKKRGTAG